MKDDLIRASLPTFSYTQYKLALLSHIISINSVLIAQIKQAAGDDRVRPGWQGVLLDAEAALLTITRGRGFDEPDHAMLAQRVKIPVGIDQ